MKKTFIIVCCALIAGLFSVVLAGDTPVMTEVTDAVGELPPVKTETAGEKIIVTYFHGHVRCPTCKKIESYSSDIMQDRFQDEMTAGKVEWRIINYEEDEHRHFEKDYELYTKTLIVSQVNDGKELRWKNLDQIWVLVGDEEKFKKYVGDEVSKYLSES